MTQIKLRPIVSGLGFAEAPRWQGGRLWLVDYFSRRVLRCASDGRLETVTEVAGTPGGLGFLPDGTPLVVSQRDFRLLRILPNGTTAIYADLSGLVVGAANELFVDNAGRAYVGHHGFDFFGGAEPRPASLILVHPDGRTEVAATDLVFPNGCALLPGGNTLIVAESFAHRLTAFDVAADGTLGNRRVWADLADHTPDGICADAEGAVWAGSPLTHSFLRVRAGGEIADHIATTAGRWAVACALGGADGRTLFCITAATTLEGMPKGQSEAFVEVATVTVPGVRTE